jgi:hypothetical protein
MTPEQKAWWNKYEEYKREKDKSLEEQMVKDSLLLIGPDGNRTFNLGKLFLKRQNEMKREMGEI